MKISIVTISFNQAKFLRECIDSVINQNFKNIEYIVVDPGSTDGSREIIESYGSKVIKVFERDVGAADGLNKGFKYATGDVLAYLNSDGVLLPGSIESVVDFFKKNPKVDVLTGHAYIINESSEFIRKVYSDKFELKSAAYGCAIVIQPSTFFRRAAYQNIGGFNVDNKSNWDGELIIDMVLSGSVVVAVNQFLSCYRVHGESITGTGRLAEAHTLYGSRMFKRIMGREKNNFDNVIEKIYRFRKHLKNPRAALERIVRGSVFASH